MTVVASKLSDGLKVKILAALDGMAEIARAEMMRQVGYLEMNVKPSRKDSICGGHQACAIGSLWLAAGIRIRRTSGYIELPGASPGARSRFVQNRPVLRHSLAFLNEAAVEYMARHNVVGHDVLDYDAVESLFESPWFDNHAATEDDETGYKARRRAMLSVIASAKRKVKAA